VRDHDREWTRELLERLTEDKYTDIRDKAIKTIDEWDIKAGVIKPDELSVRDYMDRLLESPELSLRQAAVEGLRFYEGSWARRYARKLSSDPDPSIRLAISHVYDEWRKRDKS